MEDDGTGSLVRSRISSMRCRGVSTEEQTGCCEERGIAKGQKEGKRTPVVSEEKSSDAENAAHHRQRHHVDARPSRIVVRRLRR